MPTASNGNRNTGLAEFIALVAAMSALVAITIDAMLPGLPAMGIDLAVSDQNHTQLVIAFIFIGMVIGSLFFGPLSDSIGRKPAISISMVVFLIGSFIAWQAESFTTMLISRVIQGLGVSGPRIIAMAMVRDRFAGNQLARVMSFINAVFILMPAVAPSIGQAILVFAGWRAIFVLFMVFGLAVWVWISIRQPETNPKSQRKPFAISLIWQSFLAVITTRTTLLYTIALGALFGSFLGYLNASQQIFEQSFGIVDQFPMYFAMLALAFGSASLMNAKMVMKWGMKAIAEKSLTVFVVASVVFFIVCVIFEGYPPFWLFMAFALVTFMALSVSFGNLNAMSMDPLGAHAGMGAAVISSLSTSIALPIGILSGQMYDGRLYVMALAFSMCGAIALAITKDARAIDLGVLGRH